MEAYIGVVRLDKFPIRRKKKSGEHSSPETAGIVNMTSKFVNRHKSKGGENMKGALETVKHGRYVLDEYKGLWTEETLAKEIMSFFEFCVDYEMKPSKAGMRRWLGLSKSQYWEWENNPGTDVWKSNLLAEASDFMEMQYINSVESFPTGNIFLLKSSHNHTDKQEVQITGSNVDSDDIADAVKKLGLQED